MHRVDGGRCVGSNGCIVVSYEVGISKSHYCEMANPSEIKIKSEREIEWVKKKDSKTVNWLLAVPILREQVATNEWELRYLCIRR